MILLKPVLVQRVVNYECGCQGAFTLLSNFNETKVWIIRPCYEHASRLEEIEQRLETDWRLITNGKL
jgi:hypothetical protein